MLKSISVHLYYRIFMLLKTSDKININDGKEEDLFV